MTIISRNGIPYKRFEWRKKTYWARAIQGSSGPIWQIGTTAWFDADTGAPAAFEALPSIALRSLSMALKLKVQAWCFEQCQPNGPA